jgi:hypothetical protein
MSAGTLEQPTTVQPPTKAEAARARAQWHFEVEPDLVAVYRLEAPDETDRDPLKLLVVNPDTIPTGIMPLAFPASSARGFPYALYLIEITPAEMDRVRTGDLPFPQQWGVAEEFLPPAG